MPPPNQTRNIVLVGASGTIGAPILSALITKGHRVSVLTRPSSNGVFPASVTTHKVDYNDEASAAAILAGQDVLIMALSWKAYDAQVPLIKAAAKARVPYVVPTEFGSDATQPKIMTEIDLMRVKAPYRKLIEDLGVSAWIGITNNPWVEFCMARAALGIDLKEKYAVLVDGGTTKINCTTLKRVGESLAALLALPDEELAQYKNEWAFFSSFYVSQRDLLASAMRVTRTQEQNWTIIRSSEQAGECRKLDKDKEGKGKPMIGRLFLILLTERWGGDYNWKVIDYTRLGLKQENLDEVMQNLTEKLQG
ncbi:NAD(P)-binding protein [Whalleya microplaca]|nr:NAD(P)-binding protein [Whalleya microplaca]